MGQEERLAIQDPVKKPRRKWRRRALWLIVILPLTLVAGLLVIGQTRAMQMLVEPILENQLGIEVSSGSIHLLPTGDIEIRDAVCTTDTIDNRAGTLIEFEQATISMDWWGVVKGSEQVRSIVIEKPIVRVSQDFETGVLNLAAIKVKGGSGGGSATPMVELRNGIVEIGEHDQDSYKLLKELSISGRLSNQTSTGVSAFEFLALPIEASVSGVASVPHGSISLTGQISDDGIDGVLDGIRLEDWHGDYVPARSRGMYERLGLAGDLAPTRFHVSPDGLVEVVLTLDGVALNLPFDDSGSTSGSIEEGELLRMRHTRGEIRFGTRGLKAEIKGLIDELEYDVDLDFRGFDSKSPFDATLVTDFRLDEHFKPTKFLPEKIVAKLDRFENPQADVHAVVRISRGGNTGDEIRVSGKVDLANASAIYKKFRYPFHDMTGVIEFDPDKLVVRDIKGVGPTGARLVTNGVFSPLGEHSVVHLTIEVDGVPMDEHLMSALDENNQVLVDSLFNERSYARLLDEGLVLTQDDADGLGELRRQAWDRLDDLKRSSPQDYGLQRELALELNVIDHQLNAPIFDFGGDANVVVELVRHPERPSDNRWTTDVMVRLPQAGLVSKHFPIPINAKDVEIHISDSEVSLHGGQYTGLEGGRANVDVEIDLTREHVKPVIEVVARDFPINDVLISAIPGYFDPQSDDPDDISLRRILDRLNLTGMMECNAIIGPRSGGQMGYDIDASIVNGAAFPSRLVEANSGVGEENGSVPLQAMSGPLVLNDLYGTVYVTEELIIVDLDGVLVSPGQPLAPTSIQLLTQLTLPTKQRGGDGARRSKGLLPDEFGPPVPGPLLYASAYADGIDLAMPLKHAIAVVSPRIARDIDSKLKAHQFDGVIGLSGELEGFIGGAVESTFMLNRIEHMRFEFEDTPYRLGSSWGRGELVLSDQPSVAFDGFRVSIQARDDEPGVLSLDGTMPLGRAGRMYELSESSSLSVEYANGSFDSPLTHAVLASVSSSGSKWSLDHQLGGRFDLGVSIKPELGIHRIKGDDDSIKPLPTAIHGSLKPKSLTLKMNEEAASFADVQGQVLFDGLSGTIEGIRASDSMVSLGVDGEWWVNPRGGLGADLEIDAKGALLTGPVRALLPSAVDGVIDRLEIGSFSPVELRSLRIFSDALGTDHGVYQITGGVEFTDASAIVGLPITELAGDMDFVVDGKGTQVGYELSLDASKLRAGLMRMYDARATIIGDAHNTGVVLMPEIIASMHGGQIAGSAQIRPAADGVSHYWMELHASGVRANPVFDDLLLPPEGLVGPPRPGETVVRSAWSQGQDLSRGAMIGDLTMTGPVGDPSKRTGRGLVRIAGGSVVALPGFLNLIEASNLSLPTGASLDYAEAAFYVDGPTLAFEQLSASSKRVEILGYGTLDWNTRALDLRFRSRSTTPIPIVSKLIEQLRDELITTRISGTIGDPVYSVQPLGSTMQLFDAMLGRPMSDQQRRLREVEDQVRASQHQTQRHADEIVHMPIVDDEQGWSWVKEYEESGSK